MIARKTQPTTEGHIREIISWTLHVPAAEIHAHTHLRDDLHLDDVDLLLLIIKLENSFNTYLTPEEAATIATVGDATRFFQQRAAA